MLSFCIHVIATLGCIFVVLVQDAKIEQLKQTIELLKNKPTP